MRKKILIAIVAIVLVLVIAASVIFVPKLISKESNGESGKTESVSESTNELSVDSNELKSGSEMIGIEAVVDIERYAKAYGFEVTIPEGDYKISVNDAVCYDVPLQINYFPSEEEEVLYQTEVYYIPFSEEYRDKESPKFTHTGGELKAEVEKFFNMIDSVFNVSVNGQYFIISDEGELIDNKSDAAYDALISGKANIDFTLRDGNGYYWILTSDLSEEGLVYFKFTNYFDLYIYAENIAHITVE